MGEVRDAGRKPKPDAVRVVYSIQGGGATSTVNGSNVFVNEDVCFTINTVDVHAVCYRVFESHGQDCRYKPLVDVCSTVSHKYGTGGGNVPIVLQRRFSNIMVQNTEIAPTIEAGGGEGGNNLPMILYETDDIQSDQPERRIQSG